MSKFKGTPGPWFVSEGVTHITVRGDNGEVIFHDDKGIDRVREDARLIAAAPKLLDAAIMAIEHYDEFFKGCEPPEDLPWVPVMREAIKEALGEDME